MTRFQASGPRVIYTPKEPLKPYKQLVGLYNQWQSLAPETRDWIASLFRSNGEMDIETPALDSNLDTSLTYQDLPEFGSDALRQGAAEELVGGPINWDVVAAMENTRPNKAREMSALADVKVGPITWEALL